MLSGAITFVILITSGVLPTNAEPIIAAPISLIFIIVVSLMTAPPPKEKQDLVEFYHTHLEDTNG